MLLVRFLGMCPFQDEHITGGRTGSHTDVMDLCDTISATQKYSTEWYLLTSFKEYIQCGRLLVVV